MHPAVLEGIIEKLAEYGITDKNLVKIMYDGIIEKNQLLKNAIEQSMEKRKCH